MDLSHIRFLGAEPMPGGIPTPVGPVAGLPRASVDTDDHAPLAAASLPAAVLRAAGLDPGAYRAAPLTRRVPACLRALRAEGRDAACRRLDAAPALVEPALSTLLIGVSEFFRDAGVFELLQRALPPARHGQRPLRVLSVGCSSGAELYSVAMLLAEAGRLADAYLLGVDCRRDALSAARDGVFADAAMTGVDERRRGRFFVPAAGGWQVVAALRQRTEWRCANATACLPAGPWDIILCRNLAIYLRPAVSSELFARLAATLAPGGYLVVGKAERPPTTSGLTMLGRCVYERHGE